MDVINASYRVSSWKNADELRQVFHMIFDEGSTLDEKKRAHLILQTWKVRRSQETLTGVLCTLALLDVYIADATGKVVDTFTLSTLYASSLTKFINFATSFQLREATMYRSAKNLGIDSFLIDLRHLCAHGKQLPSLEVFRKSHRYCLSWIRQFFWENELNNISDATSVDIRYDEDLADKLKQILPFYDTLAELLHKNIVKFDELTDKETTKRRWPSMDKFMQENKLKNFRKAFNFLTTILTRIIDSKAMSQNPRTFFHEMFEQCEYFMQATEVTDSNVFELSYENGEDETEDESDSTEGSPPKRRKFEPSSVVNLYQIFIWQIAKHDHLKLFLDMLYQISLNENEDSRRRGSARFWITTILRSFSYYQRYCAFTKNDAILQKRITDEVRNVYSYQFDADLTKVFIFVGTQLLPSSLKYSREFFIQILNSVDEESESICMNLLPFVYPPLSPQQLENFRDLIKIGTSANRVGQKSTPDKVYTVEDLFPSEQVKSAAETSNVIWQKSLDNIDWSSQPLGKDFSIQA